MKALRFVSRENKIRIKKLSIEWYKAVLPPQCNNEKHEDCTQSLCLGTYYPKMMAIRLFRR